MDKLVIAIFSLVGVVFGGSLQHILSRRREVDSEIRADRRRAYPDWLEAFSKTAHGNTSKETFIQATHAKNRIALYGSNLVIERLADFERVGACVERPDQVEKFTRLVAEMRRDGLGNRSHQVGGGAIRRILFSND